MTSSTHKFSHSQIQSHTGTVTSPKATVDAEVEAHDMSHQAMLP